MLVSAAAAGDGRAPMEVPGNAPEQVHSCPGFDSSRGLLSDAREQREWISHEAQV